MFSKRRSCRFETSHQQALAMLRLLNNRPFRRAAAEQNDLQMKAHHYSHHLTAIDGPSVSVLAPCACARPRASLAQALRAKGVARAPKSIRAKKSSRSITVGIKKATIHKKPYTQ